VSDFNEDLDSALFDDLLDKADIDDHDNDVLDDDPKTLAEDLEALGTQVERLANDVIFVFEVSKLLSGLTIGL
jgi:hypothetical protein